MPAGELDYTAEIVLIGDGFGISSGAKRVI